MSCDLDDIRLSVGCPRCGATVGTTYGTARITEAAACGCGALIRLDLSALPIERVQRLIDEAVPIAGAND